MVEATGLSVDTEHVTSLTEPPLELHCIVNTPHQLEVDVVEDAHRISLLTRYIVAVKVMVQQIRLAR